MAYLLCLNTYKNIQRRNGKGKYIYTNGDKYEGDFKDNKKHGIGKLIYKEKGEYYGQSVLQIYISKVNGKMDAGTGKEYSLTQIRMFTQGGGLFGKK